MRVKKLTEKQIQEQIISILHSCGVWCFLTHKVGAYQHKPILPGIADIIGILDEYRAGVGRFLAIEVKKPGGKLTPAQQEFIDTVNHHGGIAFVAESVEQVVDKLGLPVKL